MKLIIHHLNTTLKLFDSMKLIIHHLNTTKVKMCKQDCDKRESTIEM